VKHQGDEGGEPAGLVLKRAQATEVVEPFARRLDVAEEERGRGPQPEAVRLTVNRQVALPVEFFGTDFAAYTRTERLGAAAGEGFETRVGQPFQNRFNRQSRRPRHERDLDRRERLQADLRETPVEAFEQSFMIGKREVRIERADNMELARAAGRLALDRLERLLERHLVSACVPPPAPERAKAAPILTDIRRVQVKIDHIRHSIPVQRLTPEGRQPPQFKEVRPFEQGAPLVKRKTFSRLHPGNQFPPFYFF
jgi:hypothetical protein